MADFDWKATIGAVAPGLAAALGGAAGGPVGASVAAAAARALSTALLGRPDASEGDLAAAMASGSLSGEQIVALKRAELDFQTEMARIEASREAAALQDTGSARAQTVALAQAGSTIAWGAPVVSTLIVAGFFFCVYRLFIVPADLPPNAFQLLNVMFGGLSIAFGQVCNYWLGSSAGSKASGDAVRKIATKGAA